MTKRSSNGKKSAYADGVATIICLAVSLPCAFALAETDYVWSGTLDCAECHATEAASMVWEEPKEKKEGSDQVALTSAVDAYAARHASQLGVACTTCHVDDAKLEKGHKRLNSGKEATKLKKTKVDDSVCLTCHKHDALAQATANSRVLVDAEGNVANPHELPASTSSHAEIACVQCHKAHDGSKVEENATAVCASCHHSGVYECGTCH